jgi:hypothetical protein
MASRAHAINNYSFGNGHARPRRQLWFRSDADPVVLPRTSLLRAGGGAFATAFAMGALLLGSAYAAYHQPLPQLAETPAIPLTDAWQPDAMFASAQLTNVLQGPLSAAHDKVISVAETNLEEDVPSSSSASSSEARSSEPREVIIDDSKMYPPPKPEPYPNPTTTPPDAIAAPAAAPHVPTPALDPENPYRDSEQL